MAGGGLRDGVTAKVAAVLGHDDAALGLGGGEDREVRSRPQIGALPTASTSWPRSRNALATDGGSISSSSSRNYEAAFRFRSHSASARSEYSSSSRIHSRISSPYSRQ